MDHTHPHKKLYRITEGKMIAGVANGFAEYFDIDVTVMRIIFVVLLLGTHGVFAAAYIIAIFVMPVMGEPEGIAAERWAKWRAKMGRYQAPAQHAAMPGEPAPAPAAAPESESVSWAAMHAQHKAEKRMWRAYRSRPTLVEELLQLLFAALIIYLIYTYIPQTQPFFDRVAELIRTGWAWILGHLNTPVAR